MATAAHRSEKVSLHRNVLGTGFLPSQELDSLLRQHSDLCQELLRILGERVWENQQVAKALLTREPPPSPHVNVV
jgi:hypothetical protein